MADNPEPRLRLRITKLPSNAEFVPRTVTSTTTGEGDDAVTTKTYDAPSGVVAPRYAWLASPWQFLSQIFPALPSAIMPFRPQDFTATLRINGGSNWSASWVYDRNNPEHLAFVREAKQPDAVAVWHIDTNDADRGTLNSANFLGGFVPTSDRAPTITAPQLPSFVLRGMSGPLTVARSTKNDDGSGLLELTGTDWALPLSESPQQTYAQSYKSIERGTSTDAQRLALWMTDLFGRNSDWKETVEERDYPTQIGRWLLRPAFTQAAINKAVAAGFDFRAEPGRDMLTALRLFAARAGLIFHCGLPAIWFQDPAETQSSLFYDRQIISGTHTIRRPRATAYSVFHEDDAGSVGPVVRDNTSEIAKYGVIQRDLPSAAPRRGWSDVDEDGDPMPVRTAAEIQEMLEEQISDASIRDFSTEDGDAESRWVSGAKFGIDWGPGSRASLRMLEGDSDEMTVEQAVIRMSSDGDWSFRPGLGPTADLAPNIRHTTLRG